MNVYELDGLTLDYIRQPREDDLRREYASFFLAAYNEFYCEIIGERYRSFYRESVTFDRDTDERYGLITLSDLSKTFISIKEIITSGNQEYPASSITRYDTERMGVAYPIEDTATLVYFYMPAPLAHDGNNPATPPETASETNTPIFTPAEYHNALSLWAAYRYYKKEGNQKMAQEYFFDARLQKDKISGFTGLGSQSAGGVKIKVDFGA